MISEHAMCCHMRVLSFLLFV